MSLQRIISEIDAEIAQLQRVKELLSSAFDLGTPGGRGGSSRKTRAPLSAAARARIAAAQRARWAKARKANANSRSKQSETVK